MKLSNPKNSNIPSTPTCFPVSALQIGKIKGEGQSIFVPISNEDQTTIQIRPFQVGKEDNGMVEILSGLSVGEKFIVKGDRPLKVQGCFILE